MKSARGGPFRVLVVTAAYPTPGSHKGAFLKSEVEGLRAAGVDVTVLHLTGQAKYLRGAWRTFWAGLAGRYDLIHGHYSFCGLVARAQPRLPVVITFWGSDVLRNPVLPDTRQGRFSRAIAPPLARLADACVVPSAEMAQLLPGAAVTVVKQGVDYATFRPLPPAEARRALGLNPDPAQRYVLFCANPALPVKGYPIAEAAVNMMRQHGAPVELVVANGVTHEDVVRYMNACDALALPSYWEGGPFVVKEAMACNLPIVATDVGDVREVIGHTAGCFLAERAPESFATNLWHALTRGGRTTGRDDMAHLSRDRQVGEIISIYERVLGRRARQT